MSTFLPVLNEVEKANISERQPLPERYLGLPDEELDRRIAAAKAALGSRLIRHAGREPVERDTLYNVVTGPDEPDEVRVRVGTLDAVSAS